MLFDRVYKGSTPISSIMKGAVPINLGWPKFDLENGVTKSYYEDFVYDNNDYTYTNILTYSIPSVGYRKEYPAPIPISFSSVTNGIVEVSETADFSSAFTFELTNGATSYNIYNLTPGRNYYYRVKSNDLVIKTGRFATTGPRRFIRLAGASDVNIPNVRDLGGQIGLNGKSIRYGLLYRGGQFNDEWTITQENIGIVRNLLGVKAEIDFRQPIESAGYLYSELGNDIDYYNEGYEIRAYVSGLTETQTEYKNCFEAILGSLQSNKPVYFHCTYGADRTGTLAFLIEGLCGVSENDMCKDFELTCFSILSGSQNRTRVDYPADGFMYASMVSYLKTNYAGNNLAECVYNYLLSIGLTATQLSTLRTLILTT